MKRLLLIMFALSMLVMGFALSTVTIGTGTTTGRHPFNDFYKHSRSQCIYLATEIGQPSGIITKLRWYRSDTGADADAIGTTEIWLNETSATTLSGTAWVTPGTLVKTISNIDLGSGNGWYEVDIDDYIYGGSNLLVSVRTQNAPYTVPHSTWRVTSTSPNRMLAGNSDTANPPPLSSNTSRPNIQIDIEAAATNPEPTNYPVGFAISSPGFNAITLSWTGSIGAQLPYRYLIVAKTATGSFAIPTDGTPVMDDTDWSDNNGAVNVAHVDGTNTYIYTGLMQNTSYDFKIYPYTNVAESIDFKTDGMPPIASGTTLDPTITSFPSYQTFDDTAYPPAGWAHVITSGASGWQRSTSSSSPTVNPYAGAGMLYYNSYNLNTPANASLISPPINAESSNHVYKVSFWMYRQIGGSSSNDRVEVYGNINQSLTGATLLGSIPRNGGVAPVVATSGWYQYTFELGVGGAEGNLFAILKAVSAYGNNMNVDEVTFDRSLLASAPNPATVVSPANNATLVAINTNFSWASGGGAPTGYKVYLGMDANPQDEIADTAETILDPSVNLQFAKTYYWKVDPYNGFGKASDDNTLPVWTFTTATGVAISPSPGNSAAAQDPSNRVLNWADVAGATGYKVSVGTSTGSTDLVNMAQVTESQYTHIGNWPYSQQIFWTVYTLNGTQEITGTEWNFTTSANPTLYPPFIQDFSLTTFPPAFWTRWSGELLANSVLNSTSSGFSRKLYGNTGSNYGTAMNIYGTTKYWLVTPPIELSAKAGSTVLECDVKLTAWNATTIGSMDADDYAAIVISTDGTWSSSNVIKFWNQANPLTEEHVQIDLTPYSGTVKFGFYGASGATGSDLDLFFDNIEVRILSDNPLFSVTPENKAYGTVPVNTLSTDQVFTIKNAGGGILTIDPAIDITGTDPGQFQLTDLNTYPKSLGPNETMTVSVAFAPTSIDEKSANLKIVDDISKGEHLVSLTGTGWVAPPGTNCNSPYPVALPLVGFTGDTALYGDDYESAWISPSSGYIGGDDMVLQFTLDAASTLNGSLASTDGGTWIGMFVLAEEPNLVTPAAVLRSATNSGTNVTMNPVDLAAGSYFLIISTYPSPQSFKFTLDLNATPLPTEPIFAINPVVQAFGMVSIGATDTQTFTISNQGGGTMNIQSVVLTGDLAQFSLIDTNQYPKAVGEPITVSVAFTPVAEGDFSVTLTIIDDIAKSKGNHTVTITGTGFDATIRDLPYIQTWDVPDLITAWAVYNVNLDAQTWGIAADSGSNAAKIRWNTNEDMDDWLISPPINLAAGATYTVSYKYHSSGSTFPESMKVAFGNAQNPAAMTSVIANHSSIANSTYLTSSATFTPDANGTYFLGFHGYSDADMNTLYLDDIRILLPNTQIAQVIASGPTASVTVPAIMVGGAEIAPTVAFANLGNTSVIEVSTSYGVTTNPLTSERLVLSIDGGNLAGALVTVTHNLGFIPQVIAYQLGAGEVVMANNPGDWSATTAYLVVPAAKGPYTLKIIFPKDDNDTLPVTLSSFTAVLTADLHVNIAWIAESETNHAGYNILRSEVKELSTAMMINNALIDAGTTSGTQISYQYTDAEVYHNARYYYWLEDRSLTGESTYHGPLMVTISAQGEEIAIPEIPVETKLFSAFPNPFNPSTNLRYSMKEAGDVRIDVYNLKGQLLKSFNNSHNQAGYYQVSWDGHDANGRLVGTGVYFYRMSSGNYSSTKKMIMAK
ncbi:MAG: choice-of-anchor J domain-containing protein [Candidatus Cloacimonetes bacterium]|nr:choice-of-anchor J domain-containing protein [Candidatus Cloacimonadota bacterium]MDY0172587.1 choice-of-anchor J domain-containing protein [Candidatus Cloacimonadaceae bacterium]